VNTQQKNLVMLLAGAVVAGGLGLYAYFGVMKPEEAQTQREEAETTLFVVNPPPGERAQDGGTAAAPHFTWLSVEMPLGKTVMELRDNTWRITSPVSAPAEKAPVDAIVREIAAAKFRLTVEENPTDADLERYGLKQPRATVIARAFVPDAQGGGKDDPARQHSVTFYMGIENTFDGGVYVRREGDPRVYLADGMLRVAVLKTTAEWRDYHVFPVDEPSLLRIDVKARKNSLTLERTTTDKPWQLVRPVALRADPERVQRMLSEFRGRAAFSFPKPEQEALVRKALEKPLVEATFTPKLGAPMHVLMAQLQLEGEKQTVALTETGSDSQLSIVDPLMLDLLDLEPREFKDKRVLALELAAVNRIVFQPAAGAEKLELAKSPDSGKWEVVAPIVGVAKEFKVASLLGSLDKLKAAAWGEPTPKSWSKYGISDTSRGVSLYDGTGQLMARLWLGNEVKGNPERVWARGSSEDVFELEKSAFDSLPLKLEELLDTGRTAAGSP
jgi:hypothetical protein